MAVKLNQSAYDYAKKLINDGKFMLDERDDWSEHEPTADQENKYIEDHGWSDYGHWYLGVDDSENKDIKGRYKFPYGDFEKVHRCGVLAAESRAGQYKHLDIEQAAGHLHGLLDAKK